MTRKLSIQKLTLLTLAMLAVQETHSSETRKRPPKPGTHAEQPLSDAPTIEEEEAARAKRRQGGTRHQPAQREGRTTALPTEKASLEVNENEYVDPAKVLNEEDGKPAQLPPINRGATSGSGLFGWVPKIWGSEPTSQAASSTDAQPKTIAEHINAGTLEEAIADPQRYIVATERPDDLTLNHNLRVALRRIQEKATAECQQRLDALEVARQAYCASHQHYYGVMALLAGGLKERQAVQHDDARAIQEHSLNNQRACEKAAQKALLASLDIFRAEAITQEQLAAAARASHTTQSRFSVEDDAPLTPRSFAAKQALSIKEGAKQA